MSKSNNRFIVSPPMARRLREAGFNKPSHFWYRQVTPTDSPVGEIFNTRFSGNIGPNSGKQQTNESLPAGSAFTAPTADELIESICALDPSRQVSLAKNHLLIYTAFITGMHPDDDWAYEFHNENPCNALAEAWLKLKNITP